MNLVHSLALVGLLAAGARAEWADLRPGMDVKTAWRCAGAPMLQSNGRASQQWNYDRGGYILFERGRVVAWEQPRPVVVSGSMAANRRVPLPAPKKNDVFAAR